MRKLFMVVVLLVFGALWVGCAEDDVVCIGGTCVDDGECLNECEFVCDGGFNVDALECTLDGTCLCECFLGCAF